MAGILSGGGVGVGVERDEFNYFSSVVGEIRPTM